MKEANFEKNKRENKRNNKKDAQHRKGEGLSLFDFEEFKISIKKWVIRTFWIFIVASIIFGLFKIVKWGRVFNKNYIEYVNREQDVKLPTLIGEKKLSKEEIIDVKDFENRLNKIKIKVDSIEVSTSTNTFVYNVSNQNNNPANTFSIKINFDRKVDDSWNTFVSVFFSKDIKESEKDKLDYIDIRYTSKVFYKLKTDIKEDATNISTTTENINN